MTVTTATAGEQRPPRITRPHRRLVFRSLNAIRTRLNHDKKAVWKEICHLDQKLDGCYASAEALGERLGLSKRQVEEFRREWKAHGFLVSKDRPGYRNDAWFAILPIPLPAEPIPHPTVEQVQAFRDQLEAAINSPTDSCRSVGDSATRLRTSVADSPTDIRRSHIKSTEPSTELSTELRTEPTAGIQEERRLDTLETFKKKWRDEKDREPTPGDIVRFAPTGWDG